MSHVIDAPAPAPRPTLSQQTKDAIARLNTSARVDAPTIIGEVGALYWQGHAMDITSIRLHAQAIRTAHDNIGRDLAALEALIEPMVIPIRELTDAPGTSP